MFTTRQRVVVVLLAYLTFVALAWIGNDGPVPEVREVVPTLEIVEVQD